MRRALAALAAAAAIALTPARAAAGDPDLDWWTIETDHFRIHYDRELEPIAMRVARLSEQIHDRVSLALGYTPKSITEMVITDTSEDANGSATALPFNTIRLFATAPDDLSPIGDYDDWYTALLTHEYTHIAHVDNISGAATIINAVLGKTLAPNQVQPRWILEGLATVMESQHTSAGRVRSSLFDAYIRADVIADRLAGIDQFSSNARRWPQGNLWYLYGSRFLRWITDVYGPDTMRAVSADYGSNALPWGINRAIRRVTGRTYPELYEGFKDYLKRLYGEQMKAVEARGLREGTRLTHHGRIVFYPRFVPKNAQKGDGDELLYFRADSDARSGLYRIPLAAPKKGDREEELVARTIGPSTAAFTPRGDLMFHSIAPFKNYYSRNDLFLLPREETAKHGEEGSRKRLTVGRRASTADVSPDGRRVTFTVNSKGTTFLEIADLAPDGAVTNIRDLVPSARFEQAYTPRFSPDGKSVAYSAWTAGGYRDIRVVDVATGSFYELAHDRAMDMTPAWSPDGGTLYFVSDRTGIFNVYAYDLKKRALAQVTNVRVAAFMPAISNDGKTLVYSGYTTYGHDLFSMPIDPARFLPAIKTIAERPDPPTEPGNVPLRKKPYNPIWTLAPRHWIGSIKPGNYGPNAVSLTALGGDVTGNHDISATVVVEPSAPAPTFGIDYTYSRLIADFEVHFSHAVVPRSGYKYNGQDIQYDETINAITTGISYTHRGEFSSHGIGLSFSAASFRGAVPVGAGLDPYAPAQGDPLRGNINVLHLGYSFSNIEGSFDAPGAVRGFALNIGLDYASPYTGSSFTVRNISGGIAGYISMPWRGHHTLALRAAGAVNAGNYPRNGGYYVGGYDLANNSLPSTVLSGVFNGSFVLRGYPPRVYSGSEYVLANIEYRLPILQPDRGISTLPIYLRRIDGNAFIDYGGAFNYLDLRKIRFFHNGALIDSNQLHASIGAELWFGLTLGYQLDTQIRLGYAYGFSPEAVPNGQPYFVASSAF